MKSKKNLKGFTLIELIIVMAVFSILLVGAMRMLNPLNKIVKSANLQEANSATVDNIKRYLEGSLRYADCIEICQGQLTNNDGLVISDEATAVSNFIENHYTDRVNPGTYDPLSGKVRMIKIDNADKGKITEYEWDFKAGYTWEKYDADGHILLKPSGEKDYGRKAPELSASPIINDKVINPVYMDKYSFYFQPGFNDKSNIHDDSVINAVKKISEPDENVFNTSNDQTEDYYTTIEPVETQNGHTYANFTPSMFSLSVMTYMNDGKHFGKTDAGKPVFKSPFALSNINMSLVNINSSFSADKEGDKWGLVRYSGKKEGTMVSHSPEDKTDDFTYERITLLQAYKINNRYFEHTAVDGDCIYFIYTLPDMK